MEVTIEKAVPEDSSELAAMVKELIEEIVGKTGSKQFNFNLSDTTARGKDFLERGIYHVFLAKDGASTHVMGFIAMYESHALYAGGSYGTIPELYVRPGARSKGIGRMLVDRAKHYAREQGWQRLEATTPPLPEFQRALQFYEQQGFSIQGGRKMGLPI